MPPRLSLKALDNGTVAVQLGGRWRLGEPGPPQTDITPELEARRPARVVFDCSDLEIWDSALVSVAAHVGEKARALGATVDRGGLPDGVKRLLQLAEAVPVRPPPPPPARPSPLARVGMAGERRGRRFVDSLSFLGELAFALGRLVRGRAHARARDVFLQIQLAGAQALGIVSLVSFLVGLILAFVGAVQLRRFGAAIYVADLVAIAMVHDAAALISAIVLAGRTGAAYAAEIGTMHVTQEIDALEVMRVPSTDYLVLPRILALTLMLPFLTLYADVMAIVGGAVVGVGFLGIGPRQYYQETVAALHLRDVFGGLFKAAVYGVLVAGAGCYEGLRAGGNAAAVGQAATAAVVDGIVLVVCACGLFAVLFYYLGL